MDFITFLALLDLPEPVFLSMVEQESQYRGEYENYIHGLRDMTTADFTQKQLRGHFKSPVGLEILYIFLKAAHQNYRIYQELNISNEVFIETYKALPRFIKEYHKQSGIYAFERDWWAYRQIAMNIFRIGELEYEMTKQENEHVLSIHIPSDALLTHANMESSLILARLFFNRRFPTYTDAKFYCHTWLLSPALKGLLEPSSKILVFQSYFDITNTFLDNNSYLYWVFQTRDTDYSNLETKTSLQKKIKLFVEAGNKIGTASGYINFDYFIYRFESPSLKHKDLVMTYKKEMLENNDPLNGSGGLSHYEHYEDWLKHLDDKLNLTDPEDTIPSSEFLLLDQNNELYSTINIRHFLDDELRQTYGHVGASVRPKYRKQGFAKLALAMALVKVKAFGEDQAMISCNVHNIGSMKTIESCGGILERIAFDSKDNVDMRIYWIYI